MKFEIWPFLSVFAIFDLKWPFLTLRLTFLRALVKLLTYCFLEKDLLSLALRSMSLDDNDHSDLSLRSRWLLDKDI